jgi:hypothetical protein
LTFVFAALPAAATTARRSSTPTSSGRGFFQKVPELNTAKNRVHLDLRAAAGVLSAGRADPLGAECTRVVALNRLHAEPYPQPES